MTTYYDSALCSGKPQKKVVIVMGATRTEKSKLSIDLDNHLPIEVVNGDKINFTKVRHI